jgi:hypothetical protein|tara:strand:- start:6094 stop:6939 length:846 start_codon:yes stop_codon:yes gene_type:complete
MHDRDTHDADGTARRWAAEEDPAILQDEHTPVAARDRHDGWTAVRQARFLNFLAESGVVSEACKAVGLSTTSAYRLRARNANFARSWDQALDRATVELEAIAFERAINGTEETVWSHGKAVGTRRRYSDGLLKTLLQRRRPETYGSGKSARAPGAGDWRTAVARLLDEEKDLILSDQNGSPLFDPETGAVRNKQRRGLHDLRAYEAEARESCRLLQNAVMTEEELVRARSPYWQSAEFTPHGDILDTDGALLGKMTEEAMVRLAAERKAAEAKTKMGNSWG